MERSVVGGGTSVKRRSNARAISAIALVGAGLFLFACGGGGGGGATSPVNGAMSGTSMKGPVSGGTITAFAITNGTMGAQIGSGTTDAQGNFTMSVGDYSGSALLQMSGGTYTDEATGSAMTMLAGDVMTCVIPSIAAGSTTTGVQVTPLTSMAQSRAQDMAGGMTAANIATANGAVGSYFSVSDILHTVPMNALLPGSGADATQDMKNYGMAIAAMSQYAKTIGMTTSSSGIVTTMMKDASDGVMDGMMASTPISMGGMGGMMGGNMQSTGGTTGLATAMSQFVGSAMNKSGVQVSDMQTLISRLNTSGGAIQ